MKPKRGIGGAGGRGALGARGRGGHFTTVCRKFGV